MDEQIIIKTIILGVIEGLTEFLPVSSTAHLIISSKLLKFNYIDNYLFEIVIQLGAILAVICLYSEKIFGICTTLHKKQSQKFVINILFAFIPAAIIGFLFYSSIKSSLFSLKIIAIALIIGGIAFILVENMKLKPKFRKIENISIFRAIILGLFQSMAIIPGVSRSGSTIIGGLLLGMNRKTATEMSFFLAIPTIFAATIWDLYKNYHLLNFQNIEIIFIGFIASFISSIFVIKWFINFISNHSFKYFGYYRIILGTVILYHLSPNTILI